MNENGTQVAIGSKRVKESSIGTQTPSVGKKCVNVVSVKAVMDGIESTKDGNTMT